jgi:hypothetical protein
MRFKESFRIEFRGENAVGNRALRKEAREARRVITNNSALERFEIEAPVENRHARLPERPPVEAHQDASVAEPMQIGTLFEWRAQLVVADERRLPHGRSRLDGTQGKCQKAVSFGR